MYRFPCPLDSLLEDPRLIAGLFMRDLQNVTVLRLLLDWSMYGLPEMGRTGNVTLL